jgi:hypothetical protein
MIPTRIFFVAVATCFDYHNISSIKPFQDWAAKRTVLGRKQINGGQVFEFDKIL